MEEDKSGTKSHELAEKWVKCIGDDCDKSTVLLASCGLLASVINATTQGRPDLTERIFQRVQSFAASIILEVL